MANDEDVRRACVGGAAPGHPACHPVGPAARECPGAGMAATPAATAEAAGEADAALVRAARARPPAFDALYRRYLARVYRYVRTRVAGEADAADLTQDVFLRALGALPGYRERGPPFAAWLFRIARHAVADHHRRRRGTVSWDLLPEALHPVDPAEAGRPEAALLRREALAGLRALLLGLDADKRELLALRFAAGLTAPEIAATVGKREDAVRKQLARVLRALRAQLADAADAPAPPPPPAPAEEDGALR